MRKDVEFDSEGTACRGWLYLPDTGGVPCPTIVMAHGFSAVKEMRLDRFAERFATAGLASLVFDYRGFGASDGEPRQDIDPWAQITDYRNAISYARSLPEVDGERIGIWGTSYSGGHVLVVGALDRRVKAVVSQVGLVDAWDAMQRMAGQDLVDGMVQEGIEERERLFRGEPPRTLAVASDGSERAALPTPDSFEWFTKVAKEAPSWKNAVTLMSLGRLLEYSPGRFIDRIAPTPLLLLVAEQDFLPVEVAREAFERAGEPKRMRSYPVGHFAPYEPPFFDEFAGEATQWFRKWLAEDRR